MKANESFCLAIEIISSVKGLLFIKAVDLGFSFTKNLDFTSSITNTIIISHFVQVVDLNIPFAGLLLRSHKNCMLD